MRLGIHCDLAHHGHSLNGILTHGSLAGQHNDVGTIIDGVGHVGHLRSGRAGIADHGVQHLCGSDHGLKCIVTLADHGLLDIRQLLRRDLHAHVTTGDHDTVGYANDLVKIVDAFLIFDLGDDLDLGAMLHQDLLDLQNALRRANKGCGNVVKFIFDGKQDVLLVLLSNAGQAHLDTRHIDTLAGSQNTTVEDDAVQIGLRLSLDLQLDQTVIDQNTIADLHVLRQAGIVDMSDGLIAFDLSGGQNKLLSRCQRYVLCAILQQTGTDLRTLGIQQCCDRQIFSLSHLF